jgi:ribonuclease D
VRSSGPSLGTLVNHCLGRPLDKSDQFSNWEKRPLRDSQLFYAALDAYCLIQVYDVLKSCCEKGDFHFEETCYNLMTNEKMPKKKFKNPVPKKVSKSVKYEFHTLHKFLLATAVSIRRRNSSTSISSFESSVSHII